MFTELRDSAKDSSQAKNSAIKKLRTKFKWAGNQEAVTFLG
jgi:hypothetical protein